MAENGYPMVYQYLKNKNQVTNSEEAFIYDKRQSFGKSLFSEIFLFSSFRSPIHRCFKKANASFDFSFKINLITSKSAFLRSLCGIIETDLQIDYILLKLDYILGLYNKVIY